MSTATDYSEASEHHRVHGQWMSHLSIEVGHFYMEDLGRGPDRLRAQLLRVAPLVQAHLVAARAEFGENARVSTCFLVDDYFGRDTDPRIIMPSLLDTARECGVRIDYLAREAACAEAPTFLDGEPVGNSVRLAEMVASRIVAEPDEGSTGRRPPTDESGWLCNGRRSSEFAPGLAMRVPTYTPPRQFGARSHSVFLDVELWNTETVEVAGAKLERRLWSCPFLASIWQLLRLGMIRDNGELVATPVPFSGSWPEEWAQLPAVVQLNEDAAPFPAFRALSVLPHTYLGIEHAVRLILDHLNLDPAVNEKVLALAASQRISVPQLVTNRLNHLFIGDE